MPGHALEIFNETDKVEERSLFDRNEGGKLFANL